jgi:hypothetical protein
MAEIIIVHTWVKIVWATKSPTKKPIIEDTVFVANGLDVSDIAYHRHNFDFTMSFDKTPVPPLIFAVFSTVFAEFSLRSLEYANSLRKMLVPQFVNVVEDKEGVKARPYESSKLIVRKYERTMIIFGGAETVRNRVK